VRRQPFRHTAGSDPTLDTVIALGRLFDDIARVPDRFILIGGDEVNRSGGPTVRDSFFMSHHGLTDVCAANVNSRRSGGRSRPHQQDEIAHGDCRVRPSYGIGG
jgi:hypothetical protein